jgi:hypothetical protein
MGEMRNAYKILVEKTERRRPLERHIDVRVILKWILKKQGDDVDWIHVSEDRIQWQALLNMV